MRLAIWPGRNWHRTKAFMDKKRVQEGFAEPDKTAKSRARKCDFPKWFAENFA